MHEKSCPATIFCVAKGAAKRRLYPAALPGRRSPGFCAALKPYSCDVLAFKGFVTVRGNGNQLEITAENASVRD
jgi:hypothetical protein